jgi:RNA polymerase sigma-70 factor, ECF subfamily
LNPEEKEQRFAEVVREYRERIGRLCAGVIGRRDEVPDLVQEILIQVWRGLDGFRGEAALSTWVYRIALNTAVLRSRRLRREEQNRSEAARALAEMNSGGDPDRESRLQALYEAIGSLPTEERGIISLHLEGLSYEEIAGIVGISANYVGVRLTRIRRTLSRIVEERP